MPRERTGRPSSSLRGILESQDQAPVRGSGPSLSLDTLLEAWWGHAVIPQTRWDLGQGTLFS